MAGPGRGAGGSSLGLGDGAEIARIAKAVDEVSRGGLTLGEGEFEDSQPSFLWLDSRLVVADARRCQPRFSVLAQWLKLPRVPWRDEYREDFGARGEEGTLSALAAASVFPLEWYQHWDFDGFRWEHGLSVPRLSSEAQPTAAASGEGRAALRHVALRRPPLEL